MNVLLHHHQDTAKQLEVDALPTLEWMIEKEWDDRPEQVAPLAHAIGRSVAMIAPDDSAAEETLQRMQQLDVAFVLHDGEFWQHLAVRPHAGVNRNPDVKPSTKPVTHSASSVDGRSRTSSL